MSGLDELKPYTSITSSGEWIGTTREQAAMAKRLDLGMRIKWKVARWLWNSSLLSEQRESHRIAMQASLELDGFRRKVESHMILSDCLKDQLAAKTLELESLKNKIVERAQVQPIIKAKSAAEIRRRVEAQNEREFEESANGI